MGRILSEEGMNILDRGESKCKCPEVETKLEDLRNKYYKWQDLRPNNEKRQRKKKRPGSKRKHNSGHSWQAEDNKDGALGKTLFTEMRNVYEVQKQEERKCTAESEKEEKHKRKQKYGKKSHESKRICPMGSQSLDME